MKSWVCLLLMGVCAFANANTIYIWSDGDTVKAEVLADGTACNTATNTIISQDKAKHGQPCPELDQEIDELSANSKDPKLPIYQMPIHQGWIYDYIEDEFSDYGANIATIISTDKNAGLSVVMDDKKKLYVSFRLSQNVDDDFVAHYPLCYDECTIDLRVDDNKYPNIAIVRQGNMLYSKYPQTTLKRIKNGSVIKIRVPLLSGSLHTYTFVIDEPLHMRKLKL